MRRSYGQGSHIQTDKVKLFRITCSTCTTWKWPPPVTRLWSKIWFKEREVLPTKQKSAWKSNQSLNFVVKLLKTYVSPNPPNSGGIERYPLSLLLPTLMRHLWQPHVPTPHNYSLFLLFLLLNNFQSYRPLFIIFFSPIYFLPWPNLSITCKVQATGYTFLA